MVRQTAKHAAALQRVSIQQKRARDKEWHLKKRGATPVMMESPRLNYREVRGMSTQKLKAYARQLERWNKTPKTVLANGDVVDSSVIRMYRKNIKVHNQRVQKQLNKLNKHQISPRAREILGTPAPDVNGPVGLQEISYRKPMTARSAHRLLEKSKKWKQVNYQERLRGQRRSAVAMLEAIGMEHEANQVRQMESANFETLVRADGLLDDLSLWYYTDGSQITANIEGNQGSYATFANRTSAAIKELSRRTRRR